MWLKTVFKRGETLNSCNTKPKTAYSHWLDTDLFFHILPQLEKKKRKKSCIQNHSRTLNVLPSYFNVHFGKVDFWPNKNWIWELHWHYYLLPKLAYYVPSSPRKISEMGTVRLASLPNEEKNSSGSQCIDHHAFYERSTLEHRCLNQNTVGNWCHALLPGWLVAAETSMRS